MSSTNGIPTLFTAWDTPVKAKPSVLANLLALWGLMSWLAGRGKPERPWLTRLLVGFLSTMALLSADLGHAMAHIVSARYAGAPMDEIIVSSGMPRTVYHDGNVSPLVHRLRALGGPVYNAMGLVTGLLLRLLAPGGSLVREVAGWSCLGHGLILGGSLVPLPFVDGGSILKWTLVASGRTPEEADELVRRADLALGGAALAAGVALIATRRRWLSALGLVAAGTIAVAAALDRIR
jgi:hypothetical protein